MSRSKAPPSPSVQQEEGEDLRLDRLGKPCRRRMSWQDSRSVCPNFGATLSPHQRGGGPSLPPAFTSASRLVDRGRPPIEKEHGEDKPPPAGREFPTDTHTLNSSDAGVKHAKNKCIKPSFCVSKKEFLTPTFQR